MATETFGTVIATARRGKRYSQKELAEQIKLADDVGNLKSISPQYLNDIEHDRRSPSSDQLVSQFSKILQLDAEYLAFLADRWPDSLRRQIRSEDDFKNMVAAFRQGVPRKSR